MKKIKLVVILLGVIMLQSCYPYRIQVITRTDRTYYTPMYRINRFGGWREHYGSYTNKEMALEHIETWKKENYFKKKYKKPQIIRIR